MYVYDTQCIFLYGIQIGILLQNENVQASTVWYVESVIFNALFYT